MLLELESVTQSPADQIWLGLWNSLGISAPTDGMREWEKQACCKKKTFASLCMWSSHFYQADRVVTGHLRWRERERKSISDMRWYSSHGLAAISQGLLKNNYKWHAYYHFIMLPFGTGHEMVWMFQNVIMSKSSFFLAFYSGNLQSNPLLSFYIHASSAYACLWI